MLEIIQRFINTHVLVIGDIMLDEYIWGEVNRISPEAPVPIVNVKNKTYHLGGAGNVIDNIHALGGNGLIVGVIGEDPEARAVTKILSKSNIPLDGLVQLHSNPTTHKIRVIAQQQQLLRIDKEEIGNNNHELTRQVISNINACIKQADVVVLSDYGKGVVNRRVIQHVINLCEKHGKKVVVDPKTDHFELYQGVTTITPNHAEAERASGMTITKETELRNAGMKLLEMTNAESILITRGEKGMTLFRPNEKPHHIPTVAKEVFDVSGAGDTVVAAIALSLAAGADMVSAATIANHAAGIVVGRLGAATVSSEDLLLSFKK